MESVNKQDLLAFAIEILEARFTGPAPNLRHPLRTVYRDTIIYAFHSIRVPDSHLEHERLAPADASEIALSNCARPDCGPAAKADRRDRFRVETRGAHNLIASSSEFSFQLRIRLPSTARHVFDHRGLPGLFTHYAILRSTRRTRTCGTK